MTAQGSPSRASTPSQGTQGDSDVPWEKVLWREQPYPDNYVPPSFLSELEQLPPKPRPSSRALFFSSLAVSQHIATIAVFLGVFHRLLTGSLGAGQVGWTCVIASYVGFQIHQYAWKRSTLGQDPNCSLLPPPTPLRQLILPPLILSLLSPVLGTLTSATTSDSIWPLAGGLFFVHILLADHTTASLRVKRQRVQARRRASISRREPVEEKNLTSSLSLTSALSASIVLASRLPSTSHVFSLVLLAVSLFAGCPRLAKDIRESGKRYSLMLTISTILLAFVCLPSSKDSVLGGVPAIVLFVALALSNFLGPLVLWWAWRWKTHRGGGWDAAVVVLCQSGGPRQQ